MKRAWKLLPVALMLTTVLAACSGAKTETPKSESPAATVKIYKDDKTEIKLDHTPTRVVAISLESIDIMTALGVKPVGYAEQGVGEKIEYLGNALDGITKVGTHSKPNLETIASLQPDLIVIDPELQGEVYPELQKIAPTVALRSSSDTKTMADLKLIGQMLNKEEAANKFIADYQAKQKEYAAKAKGQTAPTWMAIFGTTDKPGVWMADSFVGSILKGIGAAPAYTGTADQKWPDMAYLSVEKITATNPGILFLMSTPGKELSKGWAANPAYAATDAVKHKKVYEVARNTWSRSRGPIAALKIMEEAFPLLYPGVK